MVSKLNLYQLIFALLLVFKMGDVPGYNFSWFVVVSPLIIGSINGYIWSLIEATGIPARTKEGLLEAYVANLKKRTYKKELKKLQDEQNK